MCEKRDLGELGVWKCHSCNLMNFNIVSKCQACFTSKFYTTFDLRNGYSHLTDKDLAEIIIKCDKHELKDIFDSLEYNNAIYRNHSFLSLLIDIGKINLIFLLFEYGFKFGLNYKTDKSHKTDKDEIYVENDKILPLSMAFERDEIYLIKLLLKKGASPNQHTKPENLSLHYEWFDLSRYEVYLHYLPISIPIRKQRDRDNTDIDIELIEYEEIFTLLINFGALWYEDEYMFLFCNKDASFWIDFLSSYNYMTERYFIHNAMKKYYENTIKPLILKTSLYEIEYIIKQYFVSFPMIDIDDQNDKNDNNYHQISEIHVDDENNTINTINTIKLNDIYAKILVIKQIDDCLCKQYEYTIIDENNNKLNILIHDVRIWKDLKINDVIHIRNAKLLYDSTKNGQKIQSLQLNKSSNEIPKLQIVHSMTLTPSIAVVYDEQIVDKFDRNNTH